MANGSQIDCGRRDTGDVCGQLMEAARLADVIGRLPVLISKPPSTRTRVASKPRADLKKLRRLRRQRRLWQTRHSS